MAAQTVANMAYFLYLCCCIVFSFILLKDKQVYYKGILQLKSDSATLEVVRSTPLMKAKKKLS